MQLKPFRLNADLNVEELASQYRNRRRLHIANFLERDDAERLYKGLRESNEWKFVANHGEKLFEFDRISQSALSVEQKNALTHAIYKSARSEFQFQYETIRVPDSISDRELNPSLLNQFAQFMSSNKVMTFFKAVTGESDIVFVDAQATAYGLEHFLTGHDDAVQGKNRQAAYVLNLTPVWRIEWGGILLFHDSDGHVEQGFSPTFNALNIFSIPQVHSVSSVAPFAANRRYSVTGWLREGKQPQ